MGYQWIMMTSSNGNRFRVAGPLWGMIPLTIASDAELWCFLWSAPEQTVEQTIETQVISDGIALIMTSLSCEFNFGAEFHSGQLSLCRHRLFDLTHWGRMTHICVSNLTTIGSVNDLSPSRRQAITWTNAGILLIRPLGTNFSEILIKISTFSLKKCVWKYRLWNGDHFVSASMC